MVRCHSSRLMAPVGDPGGAGDELACPAGGSADAVTVGPPVGAAAEHAPTKARTSAPGCARRRFVGGALTEGPSVGETAFGVVPSRGVTERGAAVNGWCMTVPRATRMPFAFSLLGSRFPVGRMGAGCASIATLGEGARGLAQRLPTAPPLSATRPYTRDLDAVGAHGRASRVTPVTSRGGTARACWARTSRGPDVPDRT
jgi:hypothetical protein